MDKKNLIIGSALLIFGFGLMYLMPKQAPQVTHPPATAPATTTAPASPGGASSGATISAGAPAAPATTEFAALSKEGAEARVVALSNDFIEARFTDAGGAILDVAFKKYAAVQGQPQPYVFNLLHTDPMLAFTDFPGVDRNARFKLISSSATEAVFQLVMDGQLEVTRRYSIHPAGATLKEGEDPYEIRHETTFQNLTDQTLTLPRAGISLGTTSPVSSIDYGQYLNVGFYDGDKFHHTERAQLEGGGFLSNFGVGSRAPKPVIEEHGTVQWATVKNQFFAAIYAPDQPGIGTTIRRVELPPMVDSSRANIGISGTARFDLKALPARGSEKIGGDFYVGPKEYKRLVSLGRNEDKVMQFDLYFFNRILLSGYVGPFLLTLLHGAHSIVPSWGVAIILMTLFLKVITLPFTLAASRASKRMQKLQPLLKEVREKHKDNPQRLNQATMEIFKEHKVNPMGGCLPILITIPLFVGFFAMLQSASELRFAPFLWASDLSAPDTVARIFGLPLNIMPLLMGATMVVQMRLTPTPTTDNMQAKIMQFMPIIFTLFCYNFSCALALYSTVNGLFTIGQQLMVNRYTKDVDLVQPATAPLGGNPWKKTKNVTPKKR
ncbi:MAG: membrane protein insertase YidC [Opitutaceae bacterium]|nr:membrane protein insertase YidC [Opitutaceae bacterium]